jgi:hypothetical protein
MWVKGMSSAPRASSKSDRAVQGGDSDREQQEYGVAHAFFRCDPPRYLPHASPLCSDSCATPNMLTCSHSATPALLSFLRHSRLV